MLFRTDLLTVLTLHRILLHVSNIFILKGLGFFSCILNNQNTTLFLMVGGTKMVFLFSLVFVSH